MACCVAVRAMVGRRAGNNLGKEGAALIADALKSAECKLTSLDLSCKWWRAAAWGDARGGLRGVWLWEWGFGSGAAGRGGRRRYGRWEAMSVGVCAVAG